MESKNRESEFKVKPRISMAFSPRLSVSRPNHGLLTLISVIGIEGQDIEENGECASISFDIASKYESSEIVILTYFFNLADPRILEISHEGTGEGTLEKLQSLVGKKFTGKLTKEWNFTDFGVQTVKEDGIKKFTDRIFSMTETWRLDLDTLQPVKLIVI